MKIKVGENYESDRKIIENNIQSLVANKGENNLIVGFTIKDKKTGKTKFIPVTGSYKKAWEEVKRVMK